MGMTRDEALKIMMDSINEDNRTMCQHAGMSDEDTEKQIEQSQPSLVYILGNIYDKLEAGGALA
jgi:hypothetical protein